jgi:hypothetical protein
MQCSKPCWRAKPPALLALRFRCCKACHMAVATATPSPCRCSASAAAARTKACDEQKNESSDMVGTMRRAQGTCGLCKKPGPFKRIDGTSYLEVHHRTRLADGGEDRGANTAACCPTVIGKSTMAKRPGTRNPEFEGKVFVLHYFQKKSKSGIATPKEDMDIIRTRLKVAELMAKEL